MPEKITIDKSGANTAAVRGLIAESGAPIDLRQSKYLNNLVEQDHRSVKRRIRPMLGFKSFRCAARLIAGIETMHMVKKGQLRCPGGLAFFRCRLLLQPRRPLTRTTPASTRPDRLTATEPRAWHWRNRVADGPVGPRRPVLA